MRLHQVALPVGDLDRACAFYRDLLGCEPIATFDPPGLVFFPLGETRLLLDRSSGSSALVYLQVDDVAAQVETLRQRGVDVVEEPHVVFPDPDGVFGPAGQDEWLAFVRDSEGNLLGLMNRAPSAPSAP